MKSGLFEGQECGSGYDDAGHPVPTADFDYDAVDPGGAPLSDDDAHRIRRETIRLFLRFLCQRGRNSSEIGDAVLVLNHYLNGEPRTQAELAERLGVSQSAISQRLKRLRSKAPPQH